MKRARLASALLVCAGCAYLLAWPVPVAPAPWRVEPSSGYTGQHAVNERLAGLQTLSLGADEGPEHVAIGPDGKVYAAVLAGRILRMNPDGTGRETFATTGGRVLGFDFDADGRLIAADAYAGLKAIDRDGKVRLLAGTAGGEPIGYANSVVVARSGKVYFSDSSIRFAPSRWGGTFLASFLDVLEQSGTGRVLEHDPAQNATRIVARGLSFANGVALSEDQQNLFVAETARYRVWKIPVTTHELDLSAGQPEGSAQVVLDNLPGFPDNLMRGRDGRIWLGFTKPRNAAIDALADKPFLRKMVFRLPRMMWPVPRTYGHVIAFDERGTILADLQDPAGAYPETAGVTETADRLYIHSLHASVLGWMPAGALKH